jgi:hypothetical protein
MPFKNSISVETTVNTKEQKTQVFVKLMSKNSMGRGEGIYVKKSFSRMEDLEL